MASYSACHVTLEVHISDTVLHIRGEGGLQYKFTPHGSESWRVFKGHIWKKLNGVIQLMLGICFVGVATAVSLCTALFFSFFLVA